MTAEPNCNGGHSLFSANLLKAVKLASLFSEGKHGCIVKKDQERTHDLIIVGN